MPRDFSVAYTEEELEGLKEVFRTLPTFKGGGYVLSSDIPALVKEMGHESTPEQLASYKTYYDKNYGGIVPFNFFVKICRSIHDYGQLPVLLADTFDKNEEGFISTDEFEELLALLVSHEPKLSGISSQEFFNHAARNADGKVSIEEYGKWIGAYFKHT